MRTRTGAPQNALVKDLESLRGSRTDPRMHRLGGMIGTAFAQQVTADLLATTTDDSGAFLPQASLTVTQFDTGQVLSRHFGSSSLATFTSLKPGGLKLIVTGQAFKPTQLEHYTMVVGKRASLDVHMPLVRSTAR